MERSRSKRRYPYDQQDYDSSPTLGRPKPRFNNNNNNLNQNQNFWRGGINNGGGVGVRKHQDPSFPAGSTVSTSYRILCHDMKAGGVIGKSGSIIKVIRQETGAGINVHQLIPGDEERIIEISDFQRRDLDGRAPSFSPAQEALFMIHERILESDSVFGGGIEGGDENGSGGAGRVTTRLVVAKVNVGSLLGKGGKIIEQMRSETKTQIRVLPRDHKMPRCVGMSDEIVQVVGQSDAVKKAIAIISSRLRESQLRNRNAFQGQPPSPECFLPHDDLAPNTSNISHQLDASSWGVRPSAGMTNVKGNSFASHSLGYTYESVTSMENRIVFQILCPNDKVDKVMGETDSILELLRVEVGVDVRVMDPEPYSDERIIIILSDEGPNNALFPAQEALLHIQSQIVDLHPDKDNIITTRLLVPSSEITCLEGQDGSLSELRSLTGTNIQILPTEQPALGTVRDAEIVQIVGEIRAARDAIVEITSRLRSHLFRDVSFPRDMPPLSNSASDHAVGMFGLEVGSPNRNPDAVYQNVQTTPSWPSKDGGVSRSGSVDLRESDSHEDVSSGLNRLSVPLVTRSTLEVVIPERAISKLVVGKKLAQISEWSGASVNLVEDRPEQTQRIIQISGAPEHAEKAQSLLQGFILSIQEDDEAPSS